MATVLTWQTGLRVIIKRYSVRYGEALISVQVGEQLSGYQRVCGGMPVLLHDLCLYKQWNALNQIFTFEYVFKAPPPPFNSEQLRETCWYSYAQLCGLARLVASSSVLWCP